LPDAKCPKWIRTLNEIFEDDQEKIEILQEFFGLCLTKETKYEKALFLIGEGSNGKSVISQVLESILGEENYSAIPLEKLKNAHYTINLHQKLANISIETNSKSEVYDSIFKAVVSGDTITGDQKFKNPVKFRPYCKLIIASNNMPRVDDKTSAFFRRLIILRFNRQFSDVEQNKNLKQELKSELDGIFLWALEGLNRLEERKNFNNPKSVANELEEYRKENNNVLVFVEDACLRSPEKSMAKNDIYSEYNLWCKENGFRSLSKIKFGKELTRNFKDITDETDGTKRLWSGIGTV
jgi:putative DNA primase/helicase